MKPVQLVYLLLIAASISCEKETGPSPRDLLTGKVWKLSAYVLQYAGDAEINGYLNIAACDKDDTYIFLENDTYLFMDNYFRCPMTDPDIKQSGAWSLSDDRKKLFLGNLQLELLNLGADSLCIKRIAGNGDTYTWRYTH